MSRNTFVSHPYSCIAYAARGIVPNRTENGISKLTLGKILPVPS
jgi:hypothetical protein